MFRGEVRSRKKKKNGELNKNVTKSVKLWKSVKPGYFNDSEGDSSSYVPPVFPPPSAPEVAIVGRSNVGKSTLINALLYGGVSPSEDGDDGMTFDPRRMRGKTPESYKLPKGPKALESDRPGTTRTIDFFNVRGGTEGDKDKLVTVFDLPGYGFSFSKDRNKDAEEEEGNKLETDGSGNNLFSNFIYNYVTERCM